MTPAPELTDLDKSILSIIQTDFPVAERPFDVLAERLGADAEGEGQGQRILSRVAGMMDSGAIRRLGPIFDSRSLGYASTLVAAKVPPQRVEEVAQIVSALPNVTHNYQRENAYNLWFTLTAESEQHIEDILETLRQETGIADFHSLPALTVYKIRVDFRFDGQSKDASPEPAAPAKPSEPAAVVKLTEQQKQLVRLLQESLPATARPFDEVARQIGWAVEKVITQIKDWIDQGVIRRMGAVVRHHRIGFTANGMAVFQVADDVIDQVGLDLAKCPDVSHCYRRPSLPGFPYTLFAMFHGQSENAVRAAVKTEADRLGLSDYDVLFSTVQHKKVSMRYFME